jgi:hypothetical protein
MIRAYYMTRRGAGGVRPIKTAAEAEKILRGGYSATTVRLEDETGELVGQRWQDRGRWLWFYDKDYFS